MKPQEGACLLASLALSSPVLAQSLPDCLIMSPPEAASEGDCTASQEGESESGSDPSPLRISLDYQVAYRTSKQPRILDSRGSLRTEYSQFFRGNTFVRFDSKVSGYFAGDRRAAAGESILVETNTPEAYVQHSITGANTSLKLGLQKVIWGESDIGVVTDEVSPRNFSELFLVPLDESRLGQAMLTVEHFTGVGDFSLLFAPAARFNKNARSGTVYSFDPFNGLAVYRDDLPADRREYGMRWKKTFGRSDISLMAASLIDNDYALRVDAVTSDGRSMVTRLAQRFEMAGLTFAYSRANFLVKGEVAYKAPLAFNDAAYGILQRDVVDSSLAVTYSLGRSNTVGLEFVNSRILDYTPAIAAFAQDTASVALTSTLMFLNDMLSINLLSIYNAPFTSFQHSLRTSYRWSDEILISFDAHIIDAAHTRAALRPFQDQDQVLFKIQYVF